MAGAVRGYLDRIPTAQRARSDAYFEGGYWIQLWEFLYSTVVALALLEFRLSARLRTWACRLTARPMAQAAAYWTQYAVLTFLLMLPWVWYVSFFREHAYGLATQSFGIWCGDQGKGLLVTIILGGLVVMALFGVVRWATRTWHLWAAGVLTAFLAFSAVIAPVFIAPLFNQYTPLTDPTVVEPILRLARANGIPADQVYQVDASRQTTRISANVSGMFGTERIALNDNLLKRCSRAEIEAVLAHEMGHYVLHHGYKITLFLGVLIVLGMVSLRSTLELLVRRLGSRWGIVGPGDLAVTPLAIALFTAYAFFLTPITNSYIRLQEHEADLFGLNASRQPDGFAEAILKLVEYRKAEPGAAEEWLFYDHPSAKTRITTAMRWKAEWGLSPALVGTPHDSTTR